MKLFGGLMFAAGIVMLVHAVRRDVNADFSGSDTAVLNNATLGISGVVLAAVGALIAIFG